LGQNMTVGGFGQTALKKEYGARLGWPSWLMLEIQPIGRGKTDPINIL
jgi:hypothetical protein